MFSKVSFRVEIKKIEKCMRVKGGAYGMRCRLFSKVPFRVEIKKIESVCV